MKPLPRVTYLLELNGLPLEEAEKLEDVEFLTEIYMARESLDDAESKEELEAVQDENSGMRHSLEPVASPHSDFYFRTYRGYYKRHRS